jgi:hypothetical protein
MWLYRSKFVSLLFFLQHFFFCPFLVLKNTEFNNFGYQFKWHGFVEGELDGSFCSLVIGEFRFKRVNPGRSRVKTDMFFIGGKMYQVALENESRYSITYCFPGFRRCLPDGFPDFFEYSLNVFRETTYVNINAVTEIVHSNQMLVNLA